MENVNVWFGNKYWYGSFASVFAVVIPFGRIAESYMILGWGGFVLMAGYACVFAWVYHRFYLSRVGLLVVYYLLVYYYYVVPDAYLMNNVSIIVYMTAFYFGSIAVYRVVVSRRGPSTVPMVRRVMRRSTRE